MYGLLMGRLRMRSFSFILVGRSQIYGTIFIHRNIKVYGSTTYFTIFNVYLMGNGTINQYLE